MSTKTKYLLIFSVFFIYNNYCQQTGQLKINYSYIDSKPQNAEVYLDGIFLGKTPLYFILDTNISEPKVEIKLKGYADYHYRVSSGSKIINETFRLVPFNSNFRNDIVFENKSSSFNRKLNLVPIAISAVVTTASAILAYYFKSLAIDENDEYNQTGDQSALNKKKNYDLIGGISLAVMQVGFASLLYFHFINN